MRHAEDLAARRYPCGASLFCTATARPRAELALKLKDAIAAEAKARQGTRNDLKAKKDIREKSHESSERTDEKLAEMAGVSSNTIRRVEKIVAEAEPEVVEAARKGEMSINAENRTQTRENAPRGARGSAMARAEASPKTVPKLSQNCPMTCCATLKTHFSQCLQGRDAFLTLGQFGDYRGQF